LSGTAELLLLLGVAGRDWALGAVSVFTLGDIDLGLTVLGSRSLKTSVVTIEFGLALSSKLSCGVSSERFLVVARDVYLSGESLISTRIGDVFLNSNLLTGRSSVVSLVDTDLFGLKASSGASAVKSSSSFGGVASLVTFPSDARSLVSEVDFALYLDFS
jgi:hypothetical protein